MTLLTASSDAIRADSYLPLRIQVYNVLRDAILSGRLKPGGRVIEDRVCAELGISRSPLREALRLLEGDGLVAILPRRGAVVTEISPDDAADLLVVRQSLEGVAAKLAARNITADELAKLGELCRHMGECLEAHDSRGLVALNGQFHQAIAEASRNRWIREFLGVIRSQMQRVYSSTIETDRRAPASVSEHRALFEAIERRDGARAEQLAREHVQRAREVAVEAGIVAGCP